VSKLLNCEFDVKKTAQIFQYGTNSLTFPTFCIFGNMTVIFDIIVSCCDITDTILLLFGNVFTMGNLSSEDNIHIHRFYEQAFGAKVIRANYADKNWSMYTLKTIRIEPDLTYKIGLRTIPFPLLSIVCCWK